jgi:hypothetical protein
MSLFDGIKRRLMKRKERIIPTVDRERYQLEGSFFDPDKVASVEQKAQKKGMLRTPASTRAPLTYDIGSSTAPTQRDPGKRQRIFLVAACVVLLVFGLRTWGKEEWGIVQMLEIAFSASVLTYVGLMWALRFDIPKRGYLTVLPLPSLFVFGYVLFVELFFFVHFERIYEALLFGILLALFMGGLIIVFLTANILNVSIIRKIPLLQVAHTSSYVITLFNAFFLAFFFISLGVNIYVTTVLLMILYFAAVFLHLSHFSIRTNSVVWYSAAIALLSGSLAFVMMLWPVETLFRVLLPTISIYIGVGLVMHDAKKIFRALINWEYLFILILVLIIIIMNSVWGIGGKIWM